MGNYVQTQNDKNPPNIAIDCSLQQKNAKIVVNDPNKKYIKHSDLKKAFTTYSSDGYINLNQFNQAIFYILKFNIPQVAFTHLSENIFQLLDKVITTLFRQAVIKLAKLSF